MIQMQTNVVWVGLRGWLVCFFGFFACLVGLGFGLFFPVSLFSAYFRFG